MSWTPETRAYRDAKARCEDPANGSYRHYGERGIKVLYQSVEEFINDIGYRPDKSYSLDRIDNNGHYETGNCRWATAKQQLRNSRRNVMINFNGELRCRSEWAELYNLEPCTLKGRLNNGWSMEQALTIPLRGS